MPDPLHQRKKKTQWVERLGDVVLVEVGVAKKSSCGVVVVNQPTQQGKYRNERNCGIVETSSTAIAMRQDFPESECHRRDYGRFFAQDSQTKGKLCGPHSAFDIKPDSPKRKRSSHKIGMRQRALHKKDWVHGRGDCCGHCNAKAYKFSCEQEDIRQGKGRQEQHSHARHGGLPSADGEPQCKVSSGKWRMAGIKRGLGDERVRMGEVVRGRDVKAGFIPEKGKPQQRRM